MILFFAKLSISMGYKGNRTASFVNELINCINEAKTIGIKSLVYNLIIINVYF